MTAATTAATGSRRWSRSFRSSSSGPSSESLPPPGSPGAATLMGNAPIPPLSPGKQLARAALIIVFILSFTLFLQLLIFGSLQQ